MVNVDGSWKLIDGPALGGGNAAVAGFFYDSGSATASPQPGQEQMAGEEPTEEDRRSCSKTIQGRRAAAAAAEDKKPARSTQGAPICSNNWPASAKEPTEREQWLQQMADMISFAVQDGAILKASSGWRSWKRSWPKTRRATTCGRTSKFRRMQAAWGKAIAEPKADYAKVQEAWLKQLEEFVEQAQVGRSRRRGAAAARRWRASSTATTKRPRSGTSPLVTDLRQEPQRREGRRRHPSAHVDRQDDPLKGTALQGGEVDLAQYGGKVVLDPLLVLSSPTAKSDHEAIADLHKKYGGPNSTSLASISTTQRTKSRSSSAANPQLRLEADVRAGRRLRADLSSEMGVITPPDGDPRRRQGPGGEHQPADRRAGRRDRRSCWSLASPTPRRRSELPSTAS